MAPEIIDDKGYDGLAADIFSLGATFLDCILGVEFAWLKEVSKNEEQTREVVNRVFTENEAYFDESLVDLLKQTLEFDPSHRTTAKKTLTHPWFETLSGGHTASATATMPTVGGSGHGVDQ